MLSSVKSPIHISVIALMWTTELYTKEITVFLGRGQI